MKKATLFSLAMCLLAVSLMLLHTGCGSQQRDNMYDGARARAERENDLANAPAASEPRPWSPIGLEQRGLGLPTEPPSVRLLNVRPGESDMGAQAPRTWSTLGGTGDDARFREIPSIALQSTLQAGQGGGSSPFADPTAVNIGGAYVVDPASRPNATPPLARIPAPPGVVAPAEHAPPQPGQIQFVLRPGEELLVIERRTEAAARPSDDRPGTGALIVVDQPPVNFKFPEAINFFIPVPVPLRHTDVDARIDGYVSTVRVTQQFENPFNNTIEAVYVFPLPDDAAVSDFVMTIGQRRIRGVIREREEAARIYNDARRQGHAAALLTQDRPNIFTQRVANIEPGKSIDVEITYFNTLAYLDGYYEWVFPMVVGPRFNPPWSQGQRFTDGVGAVERGALGASAQATEIQYLRPYERSGHDVSLRLAINAGVPIESIDSRSHQINVRSTRDTPHLAEISLSSLDAIPNKDFVLRFKVAGNATKSAMLTQVDHRGGFFSLMLVPPADLQYVQRAPVEMVFVVDCSGSMNGEPIAQAIRAVEHGLRMLDERDTFQIINFAESASTLGPDPIPATWENVRRGLAYAASLRSAGGTMMINGINASLGFRHDRARDRYVVFLTDGYIGNEDEILAAIKRNLGDSRIFSFGLGSSPNRHLMHEMAAHGQGIATFVGLGDDAAQVMGMFMERVSHPAMTRLEIDWGGLDVDDISPARLPDLFVGRPVLITGRVKGAGATTVKITGRMGPRGERIPILVPVTIGEDAGATRGSLGAVWARQQITTLSRLAVGNDAPAYERRITRTALDFNLMSAFTSFVAVDSLTRTAGGPGTTVDVPVPVPDGVNYGTTVQERQRTHRLPGDDGPH